MAIIVIVIAIILSVIANSLVLTLMYEALEGNEIPLEELMSAKANVVIISPTGASNQARGGAAEGRVETTLKVF